MSLGTKLREIREQKNISQRELSRRTGVAAPTLSRLERGDFKSLQAESLRKIAQELEVTVDYLIGKTEQMGPGDYVAADKTARTIFENFDQLGKDEKGILLSFSDFLQRRGAGAVALKASPWDVKFDVERMLWKIEGVNRSAPTDGKSGEVKYTCKVKVLKVQAGVYADLKKKRTELHVITKVDSVKVEREEIGTGSASRKYGFGVDEAQILSEAIDKAKEDAYRKLSA